jgi:hypothetical protein
MAELFAAVLFGMVQQHWLTVFANDLLRDNVRKTKK